MKSKYIRVGISLAVALVVSFIIFSSAREANSVDYTQAVVVTKSIEQNETVDDQNAAVKKVPAAMVPQNALKEIPSGKKAAQNLYPGQFIVPQMICDKKTVEIKPEHRIYSIPVTLSGAGQIKEGDIVDVFHYINPGRSELIISGVTVYSVLNADGKKIASRGETKIGEKVTPSVVELLVTADQANRLNLAVNTGTFTLGKYTAKSEPVRISPVDLTQIGGGQVENTVEN